VKKVIKKCFRERGKEFLEENCKHGPIPINDIYVQANNPQE